MGKFAARFAANISMLYPEHALLDRIAAAARDGFAAVEVQSPYAVSASAFAAALRDARCELVLMNSGQGNFDAGERGLAALPGREDEFRRSIDSALDYARTVGATRLHVMAGKPSADMTPALCESTYVRNLQWACGQLAPHGISVLIEPINGRDMPGYFLNRLVLAERVMDAVAHPALRLQFDAYHLQILEGDLIRNLQRVFARVGHVQIAGVPERHEPDMGEVHFPAFFAALARLNYDGWIGCEYRPARGAAAGGTSAGLGWMRRS